MVLPNYVLWVVAVLNAISWMAVLWVGVRSWRTKQNSMPETLLLPSPKPHVVKVTPSMEELGSAEQELMQPFYYALSKWEGRKNTKPLTRGNPYALAVEECIMDLIQAMEDMQSIIMEEVNERK